MVRKKKLSPSGAKDENGEYHNVHVNLHEDELAVAGLEIGDEVFVRVRDNKIIIQKADPDEAEAMARAGADVLVAHMGLTTGGTIGAETALTLDDCIERIDAIAERALGVRDDILVLCHGGPIAEPDDAAYVLARTRACHGFFGASSMERLPTEKALTERTRMFTNLRHG